MTIDWANFTPLASAAGGAIIGAAAVLLLLVSGRIAGIVGIIGRAFAPSPGSRPFEAFAFLAGLALAPALWPLLTGEHVRQTVSANLPLLAVAGLLVGFGAARGNGCTSGHGVCGLSRLSTRSLAAVITFMGVAIVTVYVARHVIGFA